MDNTLLDLHYDDGIGNQIAIQTLIVNDTRYFSFKGLMSGLNCENSRIDENHVASSNIRMISDLHIRCKKESIFVPTLKDIPVLDANGELDWTKGRYDEESVFMTEPGLYKVILWNESKAAEKFQDWLFHDVLPTLAKYGMYPRPQQAQLPIESEDSEKTQILKHLLDHSIRQDKIEAKYSKLESKMDKIQDAIERKENSNGEIVMPVMTYIKEHNLPIISEQDVYCLFAYCQKICSEQHRESKSINSVEHFPVDVIEQAASQLNEHNKNRLCMQP